jgi:hypothetical protein
MYQDLKKFLAWRYGKVYMKTYEIPCSLHFLHTCIRNVAEYVIVCEVLSIFNIECFDVLALT